MRTLVIWYETDYQIKMFWLDGDYSHLNRVYINSSESNGIHQDQLYKLVYDDEGQVIVQMFDDAPSSQELANNVVIIIAGFIC